KCITNNEPMKTRLHVLDKEQGILQCHYCNKEVKVENVKLV
ncbi:MAG: aspartate carbamoyltransferase regulatory subunit, partial [Bacteroidaceae bacterium]|nr:aspartate carbamoyltransferase regulatory subunit [Bacteroidaceae bacterium]